MSSPTSRYNQITSNWPTYVAGTCTTLSFALSVLVDLGLINAFQRR